MSKFGAGSSFGSAVFGGDASPSPLLFQIDAEMTFRARHLMARGVTDSTSLQMKQFIVGQSGFDPFDYKVALPVNPDATVLEDPIFTNSINHYEKPNQGNACVYCLLDFPDANVTLGEIGILSEIQCSPIATENGTFILSHIGHFPLIVKNDSMQIAFRVLSQF